MEPSRRPLTGLSSQVASEGKSRIGLIGAHGLVCYTVQYYTVVCYYVHSIVHIKCHRTDRSLLFRGPDWNLKPSLGTLGASLGLEGSPLQGAPFNPVRSSLERPDNGDFPGGPSNDHGRIGSGFQGTSEAKLLVGRCTTTSSTSLRVRVEACGLRNKEGKNAQLCHEKTCCNKSLGRTTSAISACIGWAICKG